MSPRYSTAACLLLMPALISVSSAESDVASVVEDPVPDVVVGPSPVPVDESPVSDRVPIPVAQPDKTTAFGGTVSSVDRNQFEALNALDLAGALRRVPGVGVSHYNLVGAYGGSDGGAIYLRGRGTGRPGSDIALYQDGAPREAGVWSHPLLDVVPLEFADRIDIYKGPQPLLQGGTFGSIDVTTRRAQPEGPRVMVDGVVGEHGLRGASVQGGDVVGDADYYAGLSQREADGHRPHSDGETRATMLRGGYDGGMATLAYIFLHTDNWAHDPGRIDEPTPERDRYESRTYTHVIRYDYGWEEATGYASLYYEDGKSRWQKDQLNGEGTPPGDSNSDWINYGFRSGGEFTAGESTVVSAGMDWGREGGGTESVTLSGEVPLSKHKRYGTISGGFGVRHPYALGDWVVMPSAGFRAYWHSRYDSEFAPQLGVTAAGDHAWSLFGSYARGVHYPGVYVAAISAPTADSVAAETMDHVETGLAYRPSTLPLTLRLALFRDEASHLLQWTPLGLVNLAESNSTGAELTGSGALGRHCSVYGGLTWLDPDDEVTPRMPDVSATLGLNVVCFRSIRLSLDAQYVGEQYAFNGRVDESGRNELEPLDDFILVGGRLAYAFTPGETQAEVYLACENLTDEDYAYQAGYPMPGRTFSGGLRFAF
jgi:outer membrane receptor protein involved in Fe transport